MRHNGAVILAFVIAAAAHAGIAVLTVPEEKPTLSVQEETRSHLEISFVSAYKEVKKPEVPKPLPPPPPKRQEKQIVVKKKPPAEKKMVTRKDPAVKKVIEPLPMQMETVETEETKEAPDKKEMKETPAVCEKPAAPFLHSKSSHDEAVIPAVPSYDRNPPPRYPRRARRKGYEGSVVLTVFVTKGGRAEKVTIKESSGHSILDRAAVDAVADWTFNPATRAGIPMAMWVDVPVRFVIERN